MGYDAKFPYDIDEGFHAIMDECRDPIVVLRSDLGIVYSNHAFSRLFGRATVEIWGLRLDDILEGKDRGEFSYFIQTALLGHKLGEYAQTVAGKSVVWSASPILNAQLQSVGVVLTGRTETTARQSTDILPSESSLTSRDSLEESDFSRSLSIGLFATDESGGWIFANPEACVLCGLEAEQLKGKGWLKVVHPEDTTAVSIEFKRAVRTRQRHTIEFRSRTTAGRLRWMSLAIAPTDAMTKSKGAVGTLTDVTGYKVSEDRHRASAERLQLATECSGTGLWDWNNANGELFYSSQMERIFGCPEGSIPPHFGAWENRIHPEDKATFADVMDRAIHGEVDVVQDEHRIVLPNGKIAWIAVRGRVLRRDVDKTALRIMGTVQDVTSMRATGEERRHLTEVLEGTPDIVLITDAEGAVSFGNRAARRLFGIRDQEQFGRNLDSILCVESRNTFASYALPTAIKRGFWRGEILVSTETGPEIPMSAVLISHRTADGAVSHLSTIMRDISVEKEQARLLEHAKEMVEEASTLRSELLANLSHEIRTPMNGVMGMTELLLQSGSALTEEQRDYLMTIRESSESLLVVISDLLDYGKVEAGEFHAKLGWFSLTELIDGLRKLFVVRFKEKRLTFTSAIGADVPDVVMSDAHRLRQMLINIIGNAVIFSPKGGTINLDVALESRVGKTAVVTVSVTDQGSGIAPEQLRSVTEAFVEGKSLDWRKLGGVSVGIGICAKLIRLMEGDIRVESEEGKGSRFSVTIPLTLGSHRDLEAFTKSKTESEESDGRPMLPFKILLVEDNPVNQKLARLLLEKLGHSVVLADDGDIGVEKYLSEHFDLVLMDVQMPRLDGYAATGKIREHESESKSPRIPIVAMTAQALEGDRERCIDAGMDDYVSKPISKTHLTKILQEISESMQRRR